MGGEAKRRAAWIAKGGKDWGLVGFRDRGPILSRFARWIARGAAMSGTVPPSAASTAAGRR